MVAKHPSVARVELDGLLNEIPLWGLVSSEAICRSTYKK